MRYLAYSVAVLAVGFSAIRTLRWIATETSGFPWVDFAFLVVLFAFFALSFVGVAMFLVVVAAALRDQSRDWGPRVSSIAVSACIAVGFLAAAPVAGGWDDGCNGHGAVFPAASTPYLAMFKPERTFVVYSDMSTLMLCAGDRSGSSFSLWSLEN